MPSASPHRFSKHVEPSLRQQFGEGVSLQASKPLVAADLPAVDMFEREFSG